MNINSLNTSISNQGHSTIGAFCFIGMVIRTYWDVSLITYGSREKINFRISNVQICNLNFVDPTNTKEIFVKQDMFQTLLHCMARVQMVDAGDSGSWVIDGKEQLKKYF